jgi:hypothetical protein
MFAKKCVFSFACGVVLAGFVGPSAMRTPAEDKSKPDEDTVLERFVGNWQTKTEIRNTGPPAREFNTLGVAVCTSSLGGTFYEFRSESIPPGESDLQVMTYDKAAKLYRQWVFSSDGYTHTADGVWEPETSTLIWKGKAGGTTFEIKDQWTSPSQLDWTLRRTNAAGKVIQTITGMLKRVEHTN